MNRLFSDFFKGKTVLVTGHTGFKGSWLSCWLHELGTQVVGYALESYTDEDNFVLSGIGKKISHNIGDIRDFKALKAVFEKYQPEIVFHLAAQALVRLSYQQPKQTYDTNIGGTVNLLECCRLSDSVRVIINITSDKCYENRNLSRGYKENDRLGGYDPYSSSKGCSEIITAAYRNSFFNIKDCARHKKAISSVRAGNVIGGGDWQQDRLVPDCIRALKKNEPIGVRSPNAVRPWQYVLEPLSGYLLLASKMYDDVKYSGAWNFGPEPDSIVTVATVVKQLISAWGSGQFKDLSQDSLNAPHEAKSLLLDISKAKHLLGWQPTLTMNEAIKYTVEWYKQPEINYDICARQINNYVQNAMKKT